MAVFVFFSTVCLGQFYDTAKFAEKSRPVVLNGKFVTRVDTVPGACQFVVSIFNLDSIVFRVKVVAEPCLKIEAVMLIETKYVHYREVDFDATSDVYDIFAYSLDRQWRPQSEYFFGEPAKYVLVDGYEVVVPVQFFPRNVKWK